MKYNLFDKLLTEMSDNNYSDDYFYDVGVDEIASIIREFTDKDWCLLKENIVNKNLEYKKKTLYCFDGENKNEFQIILSVIETGDDELFDIGLDSLRGMIDDTNKDILLANKKLMNRIESLSTNSKGIKTEIYKELSQKLK